METLKITEFTGDFKHIKNKIETFPSRLNTEVIVVNLDEKFNYIWFYERDAITIYLVKYSNAYAYVVDVGGVNMIYAKTLKDLELTDEIILLIKDIGMSHLQEHFFYDIRSQYLDYLDNKIIDTITQTEPSIYENLDGDVKIECGYPYNYYDVNQDEKIIVMLDICNFKFVNLPDKDIYGYIYDNTLTYSDTLETLLTSFSVEDKYKIVKNYGNFKREQNYIKSYYKEKYEELYSEYLDLLVNDMYMSIIEFRKFTQD
jgi:hypothetical protein